MQRSLWFRHELTPIRLNKPANMCEDPARTEKGATQRPDGTHGGPADVFSAEYSYGLCSDDSCRWPSDLLMSSRPSHRPRLSSLLGFLVGLSAVIQMGHEYAQTPTKTHGRNRNANLDDLVLHGEIRRFLLLFLKLLGQLLDEPFKLNAPSPRTSSNTSPVERDVACAGCRMRGPGLDSSQ